MSVELPVAPTAAQIEPAQDTSLSWPLSVGLGDVDQLLPFQDSITADPL